MRLELAAALDHVARGAMPVEEFLLAHSSRNATLDALCRLFGKEQTIESVENLELLAKRLLSGPLTNGATGPTARSIARFQQRVGLLRKYKSYATKATTLLGYSVFLQKPGEGFSFQQHRTHKIELFHILETAPGALIFMCAIDDWNRIYDATRFARWLSQRRDADYDKFAYSPKRGDVILVGKTGIVHSVIGCVLEEYATTSTDMVDRLHDQNRGRDVEIPQSSCATVCRLQQLPMPDSSRQVNLLGSERSSILLPKTEIQGGMMTRFCAEPFIASHVHVSPEAETGLFGHDLAAASIFVAQGEGCISVGDNDEWTRGNPPAIQVKAGDTLLLPPRCLFSFRASTGAMRVALHQINAETAFARP